MSSFVLGRGRGRHRSWIAPGCFALLAVLFYAPILFGVRAFPDGDFTHHFLPFSLYQHQQLAAGRLAVWNPYTYGGHPFLADVQAAVFYPISNFIYLVTLPIAEAAPRLYLLQVEAVLHTALAGWFAYLWTRDLTGTRWGGAIGGITFALSGYSTGYAPLQLAVLRTAIWLPLLLWTLGRAWQAPRQWRWWLGSAATLSASFLAGHSQTFMLLGYATAAWIFCLWLAHGPVRWRASWATVLAALLAVGLTATQWLPSVEFVRYSVRADVDYAFVSGGLAWADFWQLVLPRVLTQYSPLYIGVVACVLVVVALFTLLRPAQQSPTTAMGLLPWKVGVGYCLGLMIFALLSSLGGNGPLFPLLYRVAPGWSWFRGQERAALLVVIGLGGLAAYGMAALNQLSLPVRRRAGVVAGAMVVATVYAFGLLWQLAGRTAVDHTQYLLIAGMTLILGMATVVLVAMPDHLHNHLPHPVKGRNAWIVALTVVNLVWANAGTNQESGSPADRVRLAPEVIALVEAVNARPNAANGLPGRVYNEFRAYDDYGIRAQVEDVWGSSPLRVARYAALFAEFPLDRMWRLLAVEHVLTWRRELFGPSELLADFPQHADTTYLHRLPAPNPRAWLVQNVVVTDDEEAWALLADHDFDLEQWAVVGAEHSGFGEVEGAGMHTAFVTMARGSPQTLSVEVQSDGDGLLVISETWLPGWEVDGVLCGDQPCPALDDEGRVYFAPLRANLTLLGVWVPAGSSQFTLRYQPSSVRLGLWISGMTLLALVGATLWHWRARRALTP